ncbi:nucleotide exchange factor GrpE [Corynebacterium sp. Q4381]|uniref:nucleotide exchange factor GrpE n=1 Tax=Corynebacterium sp. Marseille-Q4381 TaxID=3121597 RepID=UPI002FE558F8
MRFDDQSFNRPQPPRPEPPIEQFPAVHTGDNQKADPDSVSLNVIADELNDNVGRLRSDVHKSTSTLLNEMQKLGDTVVGRLEGIKGASASEAPEADDPRDTAIAALQDARIDIIQTFLTPAAKILGGMVKDTDEGLSQDLSQLNAEEAQRQLRSVYEYFEQQLEEALIALGFEEVDAAPGTPYDRKRHKTVAVEKTADESQNDTIHKVLARGYGHPASVKPSVPAEVSVYRYDPNAG